MGMLGGPFSLLAATGVSGRWMLHGENLAAARHSLARNGPVQATRDLVPFLWEWGVFGILKGFLSSGAGWRRFARLMTVACANLFGEYITRVHHKQALIKLGIAAVPILNPSLLYGRSSSTISHPTLTLRRLEPAPKLEDFLEMGQDPQVAERMTKVSGFIQREPSDGEPSSQLSEVYLGYDDENLYAVFVAFDREPDKVRARMTRRENVDRDDDLVTVRIDTFNDERRAFVFTSNPYGIQKDSLFIEGVGEDSSWDTLWHSRGQRTDQGYVVWLALPFKSLRFTDEPEQTWGLLLERWIPRSNDWSFWPRASSRIQGFLNQAGRIVVENVSPGRNIQLIPYGLTRSFRALDLDLPAGPDFVVDRADANIGLDAKFVIKDSLALDTMLNPDFSQVESDEPQVTVNERFEVFFPEKRPFFIENAQYFQTPLDLVFTRRIADPQLGARLTGKLGPYAIGAFVTNDEAPGKRAAQGSPLHGESALYGILRVSRDAFDQGSVGMIYTDWEFAERSNRVGGADFRSKLNPNWVLSGQAVTSATTLADGVDVGGPAYAVELERSGRQFSTTLEYKDVSEGFRSVPGFVTRRDIREVSYRVEYMFRPEGEHLISWGPSLRLERVWDHKGTLLDKFYDPALLLNLVRQTSVVFFFEQMEETLRPEDFPVLIENRTFSQRNPGIAFQSRWIPALGIDGVYIQGTTINFNPPLGREPETANLTLAELSLTVRPANPHRIDTTYLVNRLTRPSDGSSIFNNHIVRAKWNWQFNRELSLRVIAQYDAVLSNETLTSLPTVKNFNLDLLMTYLVNPGTALFVGYNGNAQNIDLIDTPTGRRLIRPRARFENDAWQFFVKFSYLFRF